MNFLNVLDKDEVARLSITVAKDEEVLAVYAMRKRAVGLLGAVKCEKRPQPFVEDCAVPPIYLADFIADFRAILDEYNLDCGIFGHADAGALHVRPQLDMKSPDAIEMIRIISDMVAKLAEKYGWVLWGEHGKGLRSEYAPAFFGKAYDLAKQVKSLFDPFNQLNIPARLQPQLIKQMQI